MSSNRVYVNNLPYTVKEDGISAFFSAAGPVSNVEVFYFNGRSKGCALVTFEDEASASKAIAELNEKELDGRPLHIREDRGERAAGERPPRSHPAPNVVRANNAPRENAAPRNGNRNDGNRKIFVGNLSYRTEWQTLKDLFRDCGEVIRADVAKGQDGRSRGFGTVVFATEEGAAKAIVEKNEMELEGRKITVRLDRMTSQQ